MKIDSVHQRASHDAACVLYSPDTGKILFIHRTTVLGDAPHPSSNELEKEARAAFKDHGKEFDLAYSAEEKVEALVVPGEKFLPGHTFSVDHKSRNLVARPRPHSSAS
jgi:hypothetical protein